MARVYSVSISVLRHIWIGTSPTQHQCICSPHIWQYYSVHHIQLICFKTPQCLQQLESIYCRHRHGWLWRLCAESYIGFPRTWRRCRPRWRAPCMTPCGRRMYLKQTQSGKATHVTLVKSCRLHDLAYSVGRVGKQAATIWNPLPTDLRQQQMPLSIFKSRLKIYLCTCSIWLHTM